MSLRWLWSVRGPPLARRGIHVRRTLRRSLPATRTTLSTTGSGGLLHVDASCLLGGARAWPSGANAIHNVPAVRSISFARVLPQLALKMVRLPALFGAGTVAGLAYIQYQATRKVSLYRK